jgi:3,4-dihydroxy 2-butanone 4-phosphate synthase/GTP cyclohydrolase II
MKMKDALLLVIVSFFITIAESDSLPGTHSTTEKIRGILGTLRKEFIRHNQTLCQLPFVTASFAQSLDGKIAMFVSDDNKTTTSNLQLSSDESLLLTHALRSVHDGILIGGRTLLVDNPRLTNRFWEGSSPRPIILDTHLRNVKILGYKAIVARNPIVCCSIEAATLVEEIPVGMSVLPCKCGDDGRLDLHDALKKLKASYGIQSVMVEGGAAVLSSFFQDRLVDFVCITIAPKFLHSGKSVSFSSASNESIDLSPLGAYCIVLGQDAIFVSRWMKTNKKGN